MSRKLLMPTALMAVLGSWALGRDATPKPDPDADPAMAEITAALIGNDDETARLAASKIMELFKSDPAALLPHVRRRWIGDLVSVKRYILADDLCIRGIMAEPTRAANIEVLQAWRVKILLTQNQPQEALGQAKLLYNVATMRGTEAALKLLHTCVEKSTSGNRARLREFRNEQIAGARTVASGAPPVTAPSLLRIQAETAVYEEALTTLNAANEQDLVATGNLLLLADQPAKALEAFQSALEHHVGRTSPDLLENIARAMKAIDGTVGRANAYGLSLAEVVDDGRGNTP